MPSENITQDNHSVKLDVVKNMNLSTSCIKEVAFQLKPNKSQMLRLERGVKTIQPQTVQPCSTDVVVAHC